MKKKEPKIDWSKVSPGALALILFSIGLVGLIFGSKYLIGAAWIFLVVGIIMRINR